MTKRTIIFWTIEFVCVTAIAVVLSTATTVAKWWVAVPAVIIVVIKAAEYVNNAHIRLEMIRYQLQVLVGLLPHGGSHIRGTYHRPRRRLWGRTQLIQAFDYIPTGGGAGRPFPVEKGIIGKVYSSKAPRVENFASDAEFRARMVAEYNYTVAELMDRTADRRSYLCYPVVEENHEVLGLLYFDSDTPNTFTLDDTNPRWQAIRMAGNIIRDNLLSS